jgi:hypothetical protein
MQSVPGAGGVVVLRSEPVAGWQVWEETRLAGSLVRYEEPGGRRRTWYSVRNAHQQELGVVDVHGRAWRYKPHQREPVWLGSGTVDEGVRRILGLGPNSALREVALGSLDAAD